MEGITATRESVDETAARVTCERGMCERECNAIAEAAEARMPANSGNARGGCVEAVKPA